MSAVQFEAVVVDDAIRIPEQFRKQVGKGRVKVTVLSDYVSEPFDKTKVGALTLDDFSAFKIDTRGLKLDREDANARR